MRVVGVLMMISGGLLTPAALVLLASAGQRLAFVCAALLVQSVGLGTLATSYRAKRGER